MEDNQFSSSLARCYGVTMRAGASDTEEIQPTELPDSEAARGKPGSLWILWIILVPLFYVLSIGPAQRLAAMPSINPDILIVIYAPLRFVADNCPPIKSVLRWYVDLWMP